MTGDNQFYVSYDPAFVTPAELDERIRVAGIPGVQTT